MNAFINIFLVLLYFAFWGSIGGWASLGKPKSKWGARLQIFWVGLSCLMTITMFFWLIWIAIDSAPSLSQINQIVQQNKQCN